jgi:hypothetical protein
MTLMKAMSSILIMFPRWIQTRCDARLDEH